MVRAIVMIVLFYLINFSFWDLLVDHQMVSPQWASIIVYTILFVVCLILYGKHLMKEWHHFRKKIDKWYSFIIELIVFSLIGALFTAIAFFVTSHIVGDHTTTNQDNLNNVVDAVPMVFSLLMISVFGPVIEELTFRESMIGVVPRSKTVWLVALTIISIMAFDFIHVVALHEFWHYLPMALVLTLFYWRYERNVWSSILLHFFYNFFGYLLMMITS